MKRQSVDGFEMAYLEVGQGEPLVCIHGALCDFRVWSPVLGPLCQRFRVISPSLRHCFPDRWDGRGDTFNIPRHVNDVVSFIAAIGAPVNLLGHSRGGHIALRAAQARPDLVGRLILAEPGGELDADLTPPGEPPALRRSALAVAAGMITDGNVEGGLELFVDAVDGVGAWRNHTEASRQTFRDNAFTLVGQVNDQRKPYCLADAKGIRAPTLFLGGEQTGGSLKTVLRALATHVPNAKVEIIPGAKHLMFVHDPARFSNAIIDFASS